MKKVLFTSLCLATLMSCGQKQGPSEKEIQERIDAAVAAALESKQAEETSSSATTESAYFLFKNTVSDGTGECPFFARDGMNDAM